MGTKATDGFRVPSYPYPKAGVYGSNAPKPKGTFTTDAVAKRAGLTYRQLDYWVRRGLVTPSISTGWGSGTSRVWSRSDVRRVRKLARAIRSARAASRIMGGL